MKFVFILGEELEYGKLGFLKDYIVVKGRLDKLVYCFGKREFVRFSLSFG